MTSILSQHIACVLVPHFRVKAERQRYPALRGKPVLIVDRTCVPGAVIDHSAEARGVTAGMPLPEAVDRCPTATIVPADVEHYREVFDRMADALAARCGAVERSGTGCLYADMEGLAPAYGGEARLVASLMQIVPADFEPRAGVGQTRFVAYLAAATAGTGRAVRATGDAAAFLERFPTELLPISEKGGEQLRRWGIRTLGRLASMPPAVVQARLGAEGRYAWELACGMEPSPLPVPSQAAA